MKRGHSNVESSRTRPWSEVDPKVEEGIARIPLGGGATVSTWREFPPLAMRKEEWEQIGIKMGWS